MMMMQRPIPRFLASYPTCPLVSQLNPQSRTNPSCRMNESAKERQMTPIPSFPRGSTEQRLPFPMCSGSFFKRCRFAILLSTVTVANKGYLAMYYECLHHEQVIGSCSRNDDHICEVLWLLSIRVRLAPTESQNETCKRRAPRRRQRRIVSPAYPSLGFLRDVGDTEVSV